MGEQSNTIAAVMIRVPKDAGWAIQSGEESWHGNDLDGLIEHLTEQGPGYPSTLSLSLIFELTDPGRALGSGDE